MAAGPRENEHTDEQNAARSTDQQQTARFTALELAAGERLFAKSWAFIRGVPSLDVLPPADRPEIAFAGRSNVGKSSLINAVVRQKALARTSNTPGRTQELNFFAVEGVSCFLVDMPGYGYAEAPKEKVAAWTRLVDDYLRGRPTLKRVFMLVDARHGLKAADKPVMKMLDEAAVSYQIVLTKADKIPETTLRAVIAATVAATGSHPAAHPVIHATSSVGGHGIDLLRAEIAALLTQ